MSNTLFDKVWRRHTVTRFNPSESLIYIDRLLLHEGANHVFRALAQMKRAVRRPGNAIACADHYVPSIGREEGLEGIRIAANREEIAQMERNARESNLKLFGHADPLQGILHVVSPELGITLPGMTIVGVDSHTCTHGAFGTVAFGTGASEMAHLLATQTMWQKTPKQMRITINGELGLGVSAKDLALAVIRKIGNDGGIGFFIEFAGSAVRALTMEQRMTLCNLAMEGGARGGIVAPDEKTFDYLDGRPYSPKREQWDLAVAYWRTLPTEPEAVFDREVTLDASEVRPHVSWGTNPSQVVEIEGVVPDPAREADAARREAAEAAIRYMDLKPGTRMVDIPIDCVFIGSCTNARIEDLRIAAEIVRGRSAVVPAYVVPGSRTVKRQAEAEELDKVFVAAGFQWRDSGCSFCTCVNGDVVGSGQRCASTSNRNYKGRQGPGSRTHLVSPATAAATALVGRIADARSSRGA